MSDAGSIFVTLQAKGVGAFNDAFRKAGDAVRYVNEQIKGTQGRDDLGRFTKRAGGLGEMLRSLKTSGDAAAQGIANAGAAAAKAGAAGALAFSVFAQKVASAASDFQETSAVIRQGFGDQAKAAEDFARRTAAALGRGQQETREFMGTYQAMLAPMMGRGAAAGMSQQLTSLTFDLGSFWNKDDAEMATKLRAGLAGEAEPLRAIGVNLTEANLQQFAYRQGLNLLVKDLDEAGKMTLRYQYILEATKDAHGNAKREADGYAGTLKATKAMWADLSVTLGDQALPYMKDLLVTAQGLMRAMSTMDLTGAFSAMNAAIKVSVDLALQLWKAFAYIKAASTSLGGPSFYNSRDEFNQELADIEKLRAVLRGEAAPAAGGKFVAPEATFRSDGSITVGDRIVKEGRWKDTLDPTGQGGASSVDINWPASESEALALMEDRDALRKKQAQEELEAAKEFAATHSRTMAEVMAARNAAITPEMHHYKELKDQAEQLKNAKDKAFNSMQRAQVGAFGSAVSSGDFRGAFGSAAGILGAESAKGKGPEAAAEAAADWGMAAAAVTSMFDMLLESAKELLNLAKGAVGATLGRFGEAAFGGNAALGTLGSGVQKGAPLLMAGAGAAGVMSPLIAASMTNPVTGVATTGAGAAGAAGLGAIMLGSALFELSLQTESYARWQRHLTKATEPLVEATEPLWRQITPLTQQFFMMSKAVAPFISTMLPSKNMAMALFEVNRNLGLATFDLLIALGHVRNGANDVARGFIEIYNKLNDAWGGADLSMGDITNTNIDEIRRQREEFAHLTYGTAEAAGAMWDLAAAAHSALNVPEAAKLSRQRYLAMKDDQGNISPDAYGTNRNNGGTTIYISNATFKSVDELVEKAARGEYVNNGTSRMVVVTPRSGMRRA